LLAPAATGKRWPQLDGGISVVKESQIGAYLATQNVTLSHSGMSVSANYTLAFDNTLHRVNYFYPFMTMFALPFKSWVAVTANGTEVNGTFLKDDSFTLKCAIQWAAVFDPTSLRGANTLSATRIQGEQVLRTLSGIGPTITNCTCLQKLLSSGKWPRFLATRLS
jgi:hypothetical protein